MKRLIALIILILTLTMGCSIGGPSYVVGYVNDMPPYIYNDGNNYQGMLVELLDNMAKLEGFNYKIKKIDSNNIDDELDKKNIDILLFVNGHENKINESSEYSDEYISIASLDNNNDIKDIKSAKVGYLQGSNSINYIQSIRGEYGLAVLKYNSIEKLYDALKSKDIDYIIEDTYMLKYLQSYESDLLIGHTEKTGNLMKIKINKKSDDALKHINKGIVDMINDGSYNNIISKYR